MELSNNSQVFRRPILEGAKYGSLAGLIATWSISTAIAPSELELGLPISTVYAIIGTSLGSIDFITSAYLRIWIASCHWNYSWSVIGGIAVRVELRKNTKDIFSPPKSILMGIGTGILIWLILFLPITALIISPSIGRITATLSERQENTVSSVFDSNSLGQSFRGIAISAIAFHIVWGAIFGFILSSLLKIRIFIFVVICVFLCEAISPIQRIATKDSIFWASGWPGLFNCYIWTNIISREN